MPENEEKTMKQRSAAGKAPAPTFAGAKPASTGPAGRTPAAPGVTGRKAAADAAAPAQKPPAMDAAATHNRELQLNTNNERFWKARGYDQRPADWKTRGPAAGQKKS